AAKQERLLVHDGGLAAADVHRGERAGRGARAVEEEPEEVLVPERRHALVPARLERGVMLGAREVAGGDELGAMAARAAVAVDRVGRDPEVRVPGLELRDAGRGLLGEEPRLEERAAVRDVPEVERIVEREPGGRRAVALLEEAQVPVLLPARELDGRVEPAV